MLTLATGRAGATRDVEDGDSGILSATRTYVCWVRPASAFTGTSAYFFAESVDVDVNWYTGLRARDGAFSVVAQAPGGSQSILQGPAFTTNEWHLVIAEVEGSTVRIQVNNGAIVAGAYNVGSPTTGRCRIHYGAVYLDGSAQWLQNFIGDIAYNAIYRRILTTQERTALWNDGAPSDAPFIDGSVPGAVLFCRLNDNTPAIGGRWTLTTTGTATFSNNSASISGATDPHLADTSLLTQIPGARAVWTMDEPPGSDRVDLINGFLLKESLGTIPRCTGALEFRWE